MNTKEYVIVSALNEYSRTIGRYIDQSKSAMIVWSEHPELLAEAKTEYNNRKELKAFILNLAEEIQARSGTWIIDDSRTPENAPIIETMEAL
jgi:hypothetical protein